MSMSSYEVVRRAIEFERPERLPLIMEALGKSDVQSVGWNQIVPWEGSWGVADRRLGLGQTQVSLDCPGQAAPSANTLVRPYFLRRYQGTLISLPKYGG
jgi:hypothetical protein